MSKAVRAIIMTDTHILVMFRNKQGSKYATLVGGRINEGETPEEALVREVREETKLKITNYELVFIEEHAAPYNSQYIYLCEVESYNPVDLEEFSEEATLNRLGINMHKPMWVAKTGFKNLAFRTPALQSAIVEGLKKGFPAEPVDL